MALQQAWEEEEEEREEGLDDADEDVLGMPWSRTDELVGAPCAAGCRGGLWGRAERCGLTVDHLQRGAPRGLMCGAERCGLTICREKTPGGC